MTVIPFQGGTAPQPIFDKWAVVLVMRTLSPIPHMLGLLSAKVYWSRPVLVDVVRNRVTFRHSHAPTDFFDLEIQKSLQMWCPVAYFKVKPVFKEPAAQLLEWNVFDNERAIVPIFFLEDNELYA